MRSRPTRKAGIALVAPAAMSSRRSASPPRLTTQSASGIAMSTSTRNASAVSASVGGSDRSRTDATGSAFEKL